jgi:glycosyltransferase involved in cell wall biosynthesis
VKQILCLSNEPWSSSPGRTQQLISRLKGAQILYFAPSTEQNDRSGPKGRRVRPNITAYRLPTLLLPPEERYGPLFRLGRRRLGRFIADRAARHRFQAPLLWTTSPEQVHLLDYLDYGGLVYDCDREWDDFPPVWEGSLASAADVVFAASPVLCDRLAPCSANIALLPNGVNFPLFSTAIPQPPQGHGPVLGWVGTLWEDLDLSPLLFAARARPDWTFLLVGRQENNPFLPRLRRLGNVVLPGAFPLSDLPSWLYRCDILLNFLRDNRPYEDVISSRLYEYLSTGKPVVAMTWPDQVEHFPDVVYAAHDEQEFLTLCQHALVEAPGFVSQRRRSHAASATWPIRAEVVERILSTSGLL